VLGLAATVLIAFVAGVVEQRWKEEALRAQVEAGAAEVRASEARNGELRRQLAASDPDAYRAYVEDVARRQLNLGYPDETVVLVSWNDPPPGANQGTTTPTAAPAAAPSESHARPATNWQRWWRFLTGE
jgi:cell division protein FtsB